MELAAVIVAAVAGLAAGVWSGLRYGARLEGGPARRYWIANVVVLFGGMFVAFLGQALYALWLAVAGLGLSGGGITGLKYGYGVSVGVWAIHDRIVGSDTGRGGGEADDRGERGGAGRDGRDG